MIYLNTECVAIWDSSFTSYGYVLGPHLLPCAIQAVQATAHFLLLRQTSSRQKGTLSLTYCSELFLILKF